MAEQGRIKPRNNHSIFIERPGKPDLFGAMSNAHHSLKVGGRFDLADGDIVEFEEVLDPRNPTRFTALNIKLIARGNRVAQNNNNNNINNNQNQKKFRVFVDLPRSGNLITKTTDNKYKLRVAVGQVPANPNDSIPTRIFVVNGENRNHIFSRDVYMVADIDLPEMELNLNEAVYVETEMIGFGNSNDGKDRIQVSAKPKEGAPKAEKAGTLTTKFIQFASGHSPNLVQVTHRDASGKLAAGKVTVYLGQIGRVNGKDAVDGVCTDIDVSDSGAEMLRITLLVKNDVVSFIDPFGGSSTEFLKKDTQPGTL